MGVVFSNKNSFGIRFMAHATQGATIISLEKYEPRHSSNYDRTRWVQCQLTCAKLCPRKKIIAVSKCFLIRPFTLCQQISQFSNQKTPHLMANYSTVSALVGNHVHRIMSEATAITLVPRSCCTQFIVHVRHVPMAIAPIAAVPFLCVGCAVARSSVRVHVHDNGC